VTAVIAEPFRCGICPAVLSSYRLLLDHQEREHSDRSRYPETGESGDTYDAEYGEMDR
jgi:hypothetical protein